MVTDEFTRDQYRWLRDHAEISPDEILSAHAGAFRRATRSRLVVRSMFGVTAGVLAILGISLAQLGVFDAFSTSSGTHGNPAALSPSASPPVTDVAPNSDLEAYRSAAVETLSAEPSFVGSAYLAGGSVVEVYGAGPAPESLEPLQESATDGLTIRWQQVPFSRSELEQAKSVLRSNYEHVNAVGIGDDFASIVAYTDLGARGAEALSDEIASDVDVPVTVKSGYDVTVG